MKLQQAIDALRTEFASIDVQPITTPDPTNPDGPDRAIIAYRMPAGHWLMLQARIRHVLDPDPGASP